MSEPPSQSLTTQSSCSFFTPSTIPLANLPGIDLSVDQKDEKNPRSKGILFLILPYSPTELWEPQCALNSH